MTAAISAIDGDLLNSFFAQAFLAPCFDDDGRLVSDGAMFFCIAAGDSDIIGNAERRGCVGNSDDAVVADTSNGEAISLTKTGGSAFVASVAISSFTW
jgi:hypothetical protein